MDCLNLSSLSHRCTVCLDVLKKPVTIPCGHSYCMNCINGYWDQLAIAGRCICPQCRMEFVPRPKLYRNTTLHGLLENIRTAASNITQSQSYAGPHDVPCDVCTERKQKAKKTCMTCMASYCEYHLQPHQDTEALKTHKLEKPTRHLKAKLCPKHQEVLKMYCRTDGTCICLMCQRDLLAVHKQTERLCSDRSYTCASHQSRCLLTLLLSYEDSLTLQQSYDTFWLMKVSNKILWVQCFAPLQLKSQCHNVTGFLHSFSFLFLFSFHSDSCPLTLDHNTAHRWLQLSERNRKVTNNRTVLQFPDHPDRFEFLPQVLCREALSGTRFYWEVEWSGDWAVVGVAYKGVGRKELNSECRLGFNDKSWSLSCSNSKYSAWHNNTNIEISAPCFHRIGVYLDWPAGSLLFYGISNTMTLLHRFNTSFTEPLYPGFGLGFDSSVTFCSLNPSDQ
uniref:Tripartite motif-containing protein 16-like n=1 Tax=Erpetoichthys calabaricus TaxID=27687 RepID=A0A8C4TJ61_ERPCA